MAQLVRVAAVMFFFLSACALPVTRAGETPDKVAAQQSEEALAALVAEYPGLNVTVFRGQEVAWSYAAGLADRQAGLPVTDETRFNIYSTAKAVTGLALARQVETGALSLSSRLGDIIPELPPHLHAVRLQDILSHTSGVRHYSAPEDWIAFAMRRCSDPQDAYAYFADDPLLFEPGSQQSYSTFAFVLASEVLRRVSGEADFAAALNGSLGSWADFHLDDGSVVKAQPYVQAALLPDLPPGVSPDELVVLPGSFSALCKFGGGGLIASSRELARAGAALATGEILPPGELEQGLAPWSDISDVVYGAASYEIASGSGTIRSWSVSGGAPGGRSYLLVLVEPQISVAIAGNIDGSNMGEAARAIAEAWLAPGE